MTAVVAAGERQATDFVPGRHTSRADGRHVVRDGRRYRVIDSTELNEHFEALAHIGSEQVAREQPWVYGRVRAQIRRRKAAARRSERSTFS